LKTEKTLMNNKLSVAIALVAGLAGGMLTRFIAPAPVFAQAPVQILPAPAPTTPASVTKEIRAERFALVDQYGSVVGTFAVEPAGVRRQARIVLRDSSGREIWSPGGIALMSTVR
jgi:hypothetical protein